MIPVWIKLAYTLMAVVVVLVYWRKYGPGNFLWFSDVALLVLVPALWLDHALLASMMAVGVLVLEVGWSTAFFYQLLVRRPLPLIGGLTGYMFEAERPLWLRGLSLFHVPLPPLLVWMMLDLGYDARAVYWQTVLAWIVLALSYRFTDRGDNVNWVHGVGAPGDTFGMSLWTYRGVQALVVLPLLVHLPTHLALQALIGPVR